MDEFELYMIDTIKEWSDRLKKACNDDIGYMEKNVLSQLLETLTVYEIKTNGYGIEIDSLQNCKEILGV